MLKSHKEGQQPFFALSGDCLSAEVIGDVADYYESKTINNHVIRFMQDIDQPDAEQKVFAALSAIEEYPHAGIVIATSSFPKALAAFRYTGGNCDVQLSGVHPADKLAFLKSQMGERCLAIKVTEKDFYFNKETQEGSAHFIDKVVGRTKAYAPYSVVMFDGGNEHIRAVLTDIQKRQIRSGLYITSDGIGNIYRNVWANQRLSLNASFEAKGTYEDIVSFLQLTRKTYCEGQYA